MSIRVAEPGDAEAIAHVEAAAAHSPWNPNQVSSTLASPSTVAWVLQADGAIAGHLLTSQAADSAEILIIAVHPDHQRHGHAAALLQVAHAHWTATSVTEAWLEVRADNVPAQSLYRKQGWTEQGRRKRYYKDGADAVVMGWRP